MSENDGQQADPAKAGRGSLSAASVGVGTATAISRCLGLLRDIVIARLIGASAVADAFFVAFRIPQFFRRLFVEGAFAQALVPVLAEYQQQRHAQGERAALQGLVSAVSGVFGGALLVIVGLSMWLAPGLALLFAPGFGDDAEKLALTAELLRITTPYVLFISLTALAGAILNSQDRFVVPALTPLLLNLGLIGAALLVAPGFGQPVMVLAWAVLLAGVAQLLFQLPFLAREQLLLRPRWQPAHPGVTKIRTLLLPALFAVSVTQINLLLDTVLATLLVEGSVSWLYYSDRLAELPLGIFGIAIATVILPTLARIAQHPSNAQHAEQFRQTLAWSLRCVLVLGLPASIALIVLAEPILFLLFQYGAMQPADVHMSAHSLRGYALGLVAFMAIKVLASALSAQQAIAVAARIGMATVAFNLLLSGVFAIILQAGFGTGHAGLALGTSLAAVFNAWLLYRTLRQSELLRGGAIVRGEDLRVGCKVLAATSVMVLVLLALSPDATAWPEVGAWLRLQWVLGLCLSGLLAYAFALLVLGIRPAHFRPGSQGLPASD